MRHLLYYVFDHQYSWDFDGLKRKKLDLTTKQLSKIKYLPPFVATTLMLTSLGTHLPSMIAWSRPLSGQESLPVGCDEESGPELLKGFIKKPTVWSSSATSRCLSLPHRPRSSTTGSRPIDEPVADIQRSRAGWPDSRSSSKAKRVARQHRPVGKRRRKPQPRQRKRLLLRRRRPPARRRKTTSAAKKKSAAPAKRRRRPVRQKEDRHKGKEKEDGDKSEEERLPTSKAKKKTTSRSSRKR